MNGAKKLGVLVAIGLVILSTPVSTVLAYKFPPGATTPLGWSYDRGNGIMEWVRFYLGFGTNETQNRQSDLFIFQKFFNTTTGTLPANTTGTLPNGTTTHRGWTYRDFYSLTTGQ